MDTSGVVLAEVEGPTVIGLGDLLWHDVDNAKPASMLRLPKRTIELIQVGCKSNQDIEKMMKAKLLAYFASVFLGVALKRSLAGQTEPIGVGTVGITAFDCGAYALELGDLVGPVFGVLPRPLPNPPPPISYSKGLFNRWMNAVQTADCAIGRVVRRSSESCGRVSVSIESTVMTGGVRIHPSLRRIDF